MCTSSRFRTDACPYPGDGRLERGRPYPTRSRVLVPSKPFATATATLHRPGSGGAATAPGVERAAASVLQRQCRRRRLLRGRRAGQPHLDAEDDRTLAAQAGHPAGQPRGRSRVRGRASVPQPRGSRRPLYRRGLVEAADRAQPGAHAEPRVRGVLPLPPPCRPVRSMPRSASTPSSISAGRTSCSRRCSGSCGRAYSSPFSRLRFVNAPRSSPSTTASAHAPFRTRSAPSGGWTPRCTCTSTGLRTPGSFAGIIPSTRPSTVSGPSRPRLPAIPDLVPGR